MYGDYDQGLSRERAPRMILVAEKRAGETA